MVKIMTQSNLSAFLGHPLWEDLSPEQCNILTAGVTTVSLNKGESVTLDRQLCFLAKGRVRVSVKSNRKAVMRRLEVGQLFGCAALFGGEAVTDLVAESETELVCVDDTVMTAIFLSSPQTALRYIRFLSEKIRYLNTRIHDFSAGRAEKCLLAYLTERSSDGRVTCPVQTIARELNLGRTTVYRALDSLTAAGMISKQGRTIYLHQVGGLL